MYRACRGQLLLQCYYYWSTTHLKPAFSLSTLLPAHSDRAYCKIPIAPRHQRLPDSAHCHKAPRRCTIAASTNSAIQQPRAATAGHQGLSGFRPAPARRAGSRPRPLVQSYYRRRASIFSPVSSAPFASWRPGRGPARQSLRSARSIPFAWNEEFSRIGAVPVWGSRVRDVMAHFSSSVSEHGWPPSVMACTQAASRGRLR